MAAAPQEPQAEIQLQTAATGSSVSGEGNQGALPSAQEVFNLAAHKYLMAIDPFKPEDLNGFVYYLREILKLRIVDTKPESLMITVECESVEILDKLWDDYCTGHLNEMAQEFLVTKEILKELALTEVKLTATVLEEYKACVNDFLQQSGEFKNLLYLQTGCFTQLFSVKAMKLMQITKGRKKIIVVVIVIVGVVVVVDDDVVIAAVTTAWSQ